MNARWAVSALRTLRPARVRTIIGASSRLNCTPNTNLVVSTRHYPSGYSGSGLSGEIGFQGTSVLKVMERPHPTRRYTAVEVGELVLEAIRGWDRFPTHEDGSPKEITMDTHFVNDLGLDSLDHVEVVMCIEDQFELEIPDGDAEKLLTPQAIYEYICDRENVVE